ncbi:unnamed protein product [Mytilus edulis]|uniref:KY-like immunoglobulin-like domain-containing protein n=1 Tax=Mytilus edulis TaxID=6550 RepID=A0A8S3U8U4_MYTED|nr:unnamed protein product [Mytilus edulis]
MSKFTDSSLIVEDYSDKRKSDEARWREDLTEHFRKLGFHREVPTPELLREAQDVYRRLDWERPVDDDGNVLPSPPMTSKEDVLDEEAFAVLDEHAIKTPFTYINQHIRYLVGYLLQPTNRHRCRQSQSSDKVSYLLQPTDTDVDKARVPELLTQMSIKPELPSPTNRHRCRQSQSSDKVSYLNQPTDTDVDKARVLTRHRCRQSQSSDKDKVSYPNQPRDTDVDKPVLLQPTDTDVDKARVLTRWLARCLEDDYVRHLPRTEWTTDDSTASYLWKLRRRTMDYDELFHVLCEHADIKFELVRGCVRNTINYEVGADFKNQRKTWTAALLDGEWRLIDVRWICEAAYGVTKNNWRLIEDEKGKVSTKRAMQENRGTYKTHCRFREFYFLADPEIFVFDHFPDDDKWQLLARTVTYDEAKELPAIRSDFFQEKLTLKSHPKSNVSSNDGQVTFEIGFDTSKRMTFAYKLYRSKGCREQVVSTRSALDRFVFLERDLDEGVMRAVIRFPFVGQFLFELHGSEKSDTHHALLVTYFLTCHDIKEDCKPLPPNIREEWGPGEDTKDMGMVPLTHRKGQIEADDGDAEIKFSLDRELEFKHDLVKGEVDIPVTEGHILHTIENGEMSINVRLPEAGEYALNVMAKEKNKKTRFAPACSYLVSCQDEPLESDPFPDTEGKQLGPTATFAQLGFSEDDPWPSFVTNLVTGEYKMAIKRKRNILVAASLELEEGDTTTDYHNYVSVDTKGELVLICATFPKMGTYTLTVFARNTDAVDDSDLFLPLYVKIIEVVLPTLTGTPVPTTALLPAWCHGYSIKEPEHCCLPSNEKVMMSIAIPEASVVLVKGHPECKMKKNENGYWEGLLKTGPPGSVIDIMAKETNRDQAEKIVSYEVVSKEDLLQMEMKQEVTFRDALNRLESKEAEKQSRIITRLNQAVDDRNRPKLEKCLARAKELNPKGATVDITRAEVLLRELLDEEGRLIARKELRKATRISDIPSLEAAVRKFKHLQMVEEDGDFSAAVEVLRNLLDKKGMLRYSPPSHDVKKDVTLHTATGENLFHGRNTGGVHIYVLPDGHVQQQELTGAESSFLHHSMRSFHKDTTQLTFSEIPESKGDDSFTGPSHHFSGPTLGTSTPQKPHKSSAMFPELLREARLKSKMAQQSDDEPDQDEVEAALDEIEKEEHISKDWGGRRTWKNRTMNVFKKYWHSMKEKSQVSEETLNDDIEKEIQRLRHINTMCRKMSQAARKIGRNYGTLISSEKSFHELLGDIPDLNESLGEELANTSITQQDLIGVEGVMKASFDDFAKSIDKLCTHMVSKAEVAARDLEKARIDMETEEILYGNRSSPSFGSYGQQSKQSAIRTSFFALRNNILEDLQETNSETEEEIRRNLSGLHKKMAEVQTSKGNTSRTEHDVSMDFLSSWKM